MKTKTSTQRRTRTATKMPAMRIGHGYDLHRLKPGGRLVLAGVVVAENLSPIAHSDGDVVFHALVDALPGAIGHGDIGQMFPNSDPRWKDADSAIFVREAMRLVKRKGLAVVNADVTILAERPRLAGFRAEMLGKLRELLGGEVNVKAGTNEKCDAIGRGRAIAAHAVVLLAGN